MSKRMSLAALDVRGFTSLATLDGTPPPLDMGALFPQAAPQTAPALKDFNMASLRTNYGQDYFPPGAGSQGMAGPA